MLQPVVNFFEARGQSRLTVIVLLYLAIVVAFAAGLLFLVPLLASEARNLSTDFPLYQKMAESALVKIQELLIQKFPLVSVPDLYAMVSSYSQQQVAIVMHSMPHYASIALSVLSVVVIIPIIAFFFLTDGHLIQKLLLRMAPNRYFEMCVLLADKVTSAVQAFIRGQLLDALAVGVMTSIGLAIIGLPYFLVIGIVAGLGNLIPYLGPVIGFVPALLVLFVSTDGFTTIGLVKIIGVFAMVQFLEGTFVYPIAVGKSVNLHPLVVIIGITVGGQLGGIVGMLLVIPVISVVKVTLEVLYCYLKQYSII